MEAWSKEPQSWGLRLIQWKCLGTNNIIKKSEMIDGRGVFSTRALKKGKIIEKCPIIEDTWDNISNTVFKDYVFNHGNNVVLPIGNCIMVNHSYNPNVSVTHSGDYYVIIPLRNIKKGEELTVNYGKHWWNERKNIPIVDM